MTVSFSNDFGVICECVDCKKDQKINKLYHFLLFGSPSEQMFQKIDLLLVKYFTYCDSGNYKKKKKTYEKIIQEFKLT